MDAILFMLFSLPLSSRVQQCAEGMQNHSTKILGKIEVIIYFCLAKNCNNKGS